MSVQCKRPELIKKNMYSLKYTNNQDLIKKKANKLIRQNCLADTRELSCSLTQLDTRLDEPGERQKILEVFTEKVRYSQG